MRWKTTLQIVGIIVCFMGLAMLFPLLFALYYREGMIAPFLQSMGLCFAAGGTLYLAFGRERVQTLSHREGMGIVTLGWVASSLAGALPYYFSGAVPGFTDCFFETVSGFTTTGASVLGDVEALPHGLLMWRSLTHWLGGMGIILLSLAILPFLGVGGMQLYQAEVPGPTPDKLRPRIKDTALLLWKVYLFFTGMEVLLLLLGGMGFFDAVCHTFGTMATGGFSTKNGSIGHFSSVYIQLVIVAFMFIAGTNFALHFKLLRGNPKAYWQDAEFRFFAIAILVLVLLCTAGMWRTVYDSPLRALQDSLFQVVSIVTTTGYVTADYEQWTSMGQVILLLCMFLGGSAGSTGGGIKCMRIMLLAKHATRELKRVVHPRAVVPVKMGGRIISDEVVAGVWGFFSLYLGLLCITTVVLAGLGVDVFTSFAAVIACIGNIGPGLAGVGPMDNYARIPELGKWMLTFCMLLGRLEIFTVVILLFPEFWRK